MGRYKVEAIIVRELSTLRIIVYDTKTIYVFPKKWRYGIIYHAWYTPLGFWEKSWKPFRRALLERHVDLMDCQRLAQKYGVQAVSTTRKLNLSGRKVEYRK